MSFECDDERCVEARGDAAAGPPWPSYGAAFNINTFQTHQFKGTRSSCACLSLGSVSLQLSML